MKPVLCVGYSSHVSFDFYLTSHATAGLSDFQWLSVPFLARAPEAPSDMLPSLTSLPIASLHAPYQPALFFPYSFAFPQAAMLLLSFTIGLHCFHRLKCPPSSHFTWLMLAPYKAFSEPLSLRLDGLDTFLWAPLGSVHASVIKYIILYLFTCVSP